MPPPCAGRRWCRSPPTYAGSEAAALRLVDIGSGTGDFLTFVKDNWPEVSVGAVDLSRFYLAQASRRLQRWGGTGAVAAAAERLPFADASVDVVTCIYLLHEVPDGERAADRGGGARGC